LADQKKPHCDCGARLRYVRSVLFGQHERQNPRDDGLSICALDIRLLIQVDLEELRPSVVLEISEIALAVRIVVQTEFIFL